MKGDSAADAANDRLNGATGEDDIDGGETAGDKGKTSFNHAPIQEGGETLYRCCTLETKRMV